AGVEIVGRAEVAGVDGPGTVVVLGDGVVLGRGAELAEEALDVAGDRRVRSAGAPARAPEDRYHARGVDDRSAVVDEIRSAMTLGARGELLLGREVVRVRIQLGVLVGSGASRDRESGDEQHLPHVWAPSLQLEPACCMAGRRQRFRPTSEVATLPTAGPLQLALGVFLRDGLPLVRACLALGVAQLELHAPVLEV